MDCNTPGFPPHHQLLELAQTHQTAMGEFNSDDHDSYYGRQESLRRNGVALIVNRESEMQYLDAISKMTEFVSKAKSFNITVIQVYAPTSNAEEAEVEWFYEDLQDLLEQKPKKRSFPHRVLECKSRKSRDIWSNRQIWPCSTK